MSDDATGQTVERVNSRLALLLQRAHIALRGEGDFDARDVLQLRNAIAEMPGIVARWAELQQLQPSLVEPCERYKTHLRELQTMLVQIRLMLHAQKAELNARQQHCTAVARWAAAARLIRSS